MNQSEIWMNQSEIWVNQSEIWMNQSSKVQIPGGFPEEEEGLEASNWLMHNFVDDFHSGLRSPGWSDYTMIFYSWA